jgi:hypothetical protein
MGAHALPPPLLAQRSRSMTLSNSLYCRLIAGALLLLAVAAQIFSPTDSPNAPLHLVIPSFFYPASWSVAIFLLIILSMRDRAILAGSVTACAAAGAIVVLARNGSLDDVRRLYFVVAGIAPYLFLLFRIAVNSGAERSRWIDILAVVSLIHISALGANFFREQTGHCLDNIFDQRIATLDEAFGAQFSAVMAYVLGKLPPLYDLSWVAYNFVQIPIAIVAAFHWKRKSAESFSILPAFILGSIIGYGCYWLTPAIGPAAYFGAGFPLLHATPDYLAHQPLEFRSSLERNAMPSMHISWAILIFLYSRGLPIWGRCFAGLFVFLTACATLGFGQHYLMDLVVATPLVLLIRALFMNDLPVAKVERLRALGAGGAVLGFWIAIIRFAPAAPAPWAVVYLTGLTLWMSFFLERALARAEARAYASTRESASNDGQRETVFAQAS